MYGTSFFVFFEGRGKEALALEFKEFVEALLGEEAGVGRALERPWEDPSIVKRTRTKTAPGEPGHDGPWSFARCVFSFPTYEERFRSLERAEEEWLEEDLHPKARRRASEEEILAAEAFEEEDESLYLFGSDMPPEWRDAPMILCFPAFALPVRTPEELQASRPRAKKILRWLRRRQSRRDRLEIHLSAGYYAPIYLTPQELTPARLLTMAVELQEEPADEAPSSALDLDFGSENPELGWEEPKDLPSWPARIWQRLVS